MAVKSKKNVNKPYSDSDTNIDWSKLFDSGATPWGGNPSVAVDISSAIDHSIDIGPDTIDAWARPRNNEISAQVCVPIRQMSGNEGIVREMARRDVAMAIAEQLVKQGYIRFDENIDYDGWGDRMIVRGTLNIFS